MFNWLKEVMSDGALGNASAKRFAVVLGAISLSFAVVILAVAACFGNTVDNALWATSTSLAGLGGVAYVGGKVAER